MNITSVNPKISNWKELKEQFGLNKPIGKGYKTAIEIFNDLIVANKQFDLNSKEPQPQIVKSGIMTFVGSESENTFNSITIDCEKEAFDSAICIFRLVGVDGAHRVYEFTGTVK